MSTLAFDTHRFIKRLADAGMPEPQAEILAEEQAQLIGERLATKDDLERMELRLSNHLIKWVAGLLMAQAAVVAALVKLL
jgi:hypothetical protein